ncbi:unnamed protein product, partial [Staurois parvus]
MHSPKKKKHYLAIHTKLSMCSLSSNLCSIRRYIGDCGRRGGSEKTESNILFTQCGGLTPWGSTVSITSMLYYQGQIDNLWGPRAIGDHGAPVSLPKLKKAY